MSLKEKLDGVKKTVEVKRTKENIVKDTESLADVVSEKQALGEKIVRAYEILNGLEQNYTGASKAAKEFKAVSSKINALFEEYKDSLGERGINSVAEMINDDEIAKDDEVKQYKQKGVKGADVFEPGAHGELGLQVKTLSSLKEYAKMEFPALELNFAGGRKRGGSERAETPRELSMKEITRYIHGLEIDSQVLTEKENQAKAEFLPKVDLLVKENIDRFFGRGNFSLDPYSSEINFINDEVFKACGDAYWPDVKAEAKKIIEAKYNERKIGFNKKDEKDIDKSLEAEKLIYDVTELRLDNERVLKLEQDRYNISNLKRELSRQIFKNDSNKTIVFKDKKAFPGDILKLAEELQTKNPEANKICGKLKGDYLETLYNLGNNLKAGIFTGGEQKKAIQDVKDKLAKMIAKINKIDIPDNFYQPEVYKFGNDIVLTRPDFDNKYLKYDWFKTLESRFNIASQQFNQGLNELSKQEYPATSKLDEALYNFQLEKTVPVGGYQIPVAPVANNYFYKDIVDKNRINSFIKGLEGKSLSQKEMWDEFAKINNEFNNEINDTPEGKTVINKFNSLMLKYNENFRGILGLVNVKLQGRRGDSITFQDRNEEDHIVKQKLFYK